MTQTTLFPDTTNYEMQRAPEPRNSTRKSYDSLKPYKSGFTRVSWALNHGSPRCVCMGCNDGFNSVAAFDKHQVLTSDGTVICRDPATLGMVRNEDDWWITGVNTRVFR